EPELLLRPPGVRGHAPHVVLGDTPSALLHGGVVNAARGAPPGERAGVGVELHRHAVPPLPQRPREGRYLDQLLPAEGEPPFQFAVELGLDLEVERDVQGRARLRAPQRATAWAVLTCFQSA